MNASGTSLIVPAVRVLITGPHGFERTVTFPLDEAPATITQQARETLED